MRQITSDDHPTELEIDSEFGGDLPFSPRMPAVCGRWPFFIALGSRVWVARSASPGNSCESGNTNLERQCAFLPTQPPRGLGFQGCVPLNATGSKSPSALLQLPGRDSLGAAEGIAWKLLHREFFPPCARYRVRRYRTGPAPELFRMTREKLQACSKKTLAEMARKKGIAHWATLRKEELIEALTATSRRPAAKPKA